MLPLARQRAAWLRAREVGDLGCTLGEGSNGEYRAHERANELFHRNASGAQRVFCSASTHVVNGSPRRSLASMRPALAGVRSRSSSRNPGRLVETMLWTVAPAAGVAPSGNGRGSGTSAHAPPLPDMN